MQIKTSPHPVLLLQFWTESPKYLLFLSFLAKEQSLRQTSTDKPFIYLPKNNPSNIFEKAQNIKKKEKNCLSVSMG